jgi:hypothetical protein
VLCVLLLLLLLQNWTDGWEDVVRVVAAIGALSAEGQPVAHKGTAARAAE